MRPNPLLVRAYVGRGVRLWLATRALMTLALLWAEMNPLRVSAGGAAQIVALAVGLSFLEIHIRRERALLANLGARPVTLGALFAAPALIGEIVLGLGAAAIT